MVGRVASTTGGTVLGLELNLDGPVESCEWRMVPVPATKVKCPGWSGAFHFLQ